MDQTLQVQFGDLGDILPKELDRLIRLPDYPVNAGCLMGAFVADNGQLAQWEKQWKAEAYRLEAVDLVGEPTTLAEKEAGSNGKMLTQSDPLPQTMYHCEAAPGSPLLVELPLQISK